jgi:hypothetical protein
VGAVEVFAMALRVEVFAVVVSVAVFEAMPAAD